MNKTANPIIRLTDNSTGSTATEYILLSEYRKLERKNKELTEEIERLNKQLGIVGDRKKSSNVECGILDYECPDVWEDKRRDNEIKKQKLREAREKYGR
ncbi:hypothetical protein E2P64_06520 [Candidatus Bathyarchaeota archaeon]|nr:hypothetical protein E2P64_06520 [Candidatus Bathyarchaeota archaeon]